MLKFFLGALALMALAAPVGAQTAAQTAAQTGATPAAAQKSAPQKLAASDISISRLRAVANGRTPPPAAVPPGCGSSHKHKAAACTRPIASVTLPPSMRSRNPAAPAARPRKAVHLAAIHRQAAKSAGRKTAPRHAASSARRRRLARAD